MRTLYLSTFSARSIQLTFDWVDDLVLGLGDEVQGVDHVVGVELLAVVELHALAQVELERLVVDLPPGGGELALVLAAVRIAIDQRVPDVLADDHADADVVEVGIDVLRRLVVSELDALIALAGECGCRRGENGGESEAAEELVRGGHIHDPSFECAVVAAGLVAVAAEAPSDCLGVGVGQDRLRSATSIGVRKSSDMRETIRSFSSAAVVMVGSQRPATFSSLPYQSTR